MFNFYVLYLLANLKAEKRAIKSIQTTTTIYNFFWEGMTWAKRKMILNNKKEY